MNKGNPFEAVFRNYVEWFGGTVLSEAPGAKTADYWFPSYNVIAELKTMATNTSSHIDAKVTAIAEEWIRKTGKRPPGHIEGDQYIIEIKNMPQEIAVRWKKLLSDSVERYVRDANKQIQQTKKRLGMPQAIGSLLISNPENIYFRDPKSFEQLLVEVLHKRDRGGALRFPHINGAVYFSANAVKEPKKSMYFWYQIGIKRGKSSCHIELERFHNDLQQGWYHYIEALQGVKIRQHSVNELPGFV